MEIQATLNKNFNGEFKILITHAISNGYEIITPTVENGVKWETERQGSPGKLTFKIYKNQNEDIEFQEGDAVALKYRNDGESWVTVFNGYIFKKKRSKDGWIDITAYDQLRYFKNKATYVYTNKKASEVVKMLSNDYQLLIGTLEDSSYVISNRVEDNQSLFDVVQNAIDQTLISSGELYVLYSDGNGICLRNAKNMKLDLIITKSTAENFDYTSSIDDDVYNEIELYYDNDETNKREYYNAADKNTMKQWGRLRLTESVQNPSNVKDRVMKMLKLYNQKSRELKVTGAFGDYRCRAGASVMVQLDLGDVKVSNYMLIEKATHTFKKDEYRMDLTLSDKEISV